MASESHGGEVWRLTARFADYRSLPAARLLGYSAPPGACVPPTPGYAAAALSLPLRATATKRIPGYAGESIPPAGSLRGDSRPVGSSPTTRVHLAARSPA